MARPQDLDNEAIATRLEGFAALLDLAGSSFYTVRAYRRAADLIRSTPAPVATLVRAGRARELRGVGPGIEARLRELVETGDIAELAELERTTSPELVGVGRLLGVNPQRMLALSAEARRAHRGRVPGRRARGRLRTASGIGPKTEERLLAALEASERPRAPRGLTLNRAWELSGAIAERLGGEVAGEPRRWRELSDRLAVVVAAERPGPVLDAFASLPQIVAILERGPRTAVGVTVEGVPVELAVAAPARFGSELLRLTGPSPTCPRWATCRTARTRRASTRRSGCRTGRRSSARIRRARGRRRRRGSSALDDVRGDLHCHTTWSDGKASVLEMAESARGRGYEYLAICDHTVSVRVVPGLGADDVRRQGEEIAAANERLAPFRILRGIEADILPDGSLDLPDDVLAELDWVQASLHAGQRGRAAS